MKWIDAKKLPPPRGATVLAFWTPKGGPVHPGCWAVATYYHPGNWHNPEDDEDGYAEPTHWMTLPKAPEVITVSGGRAQNENDRAQNENAGSGV